MKNKLNFKELSKKILNICILLSFVLTLLVPITGIMVHKMASMLFLLLCIIHLIIYRRKMNLKRLGMAVLIIAAFLTGIFGMIFDNIPVIMALHTVISVSVVFFTAIHIFIYRYKLIGRGKKQMV